MKYSVHAFLLLIFILANTQLFAADSGAANSPTVPACTALPSEGEQAREVHDQSKLFTVASFILGKPNSAPEYTTPPDLCALEEFSSGDYAVSPKYAPFSRGMQNLHYLFEAKKADSLRTILVLYSGFVTFTYNDGTYFYLAEVDGSSTAIYALYKRQPNFDVVKGKLDRILAGAAAPELVVRGDKILIK
jgi:hypothetical protein